MSKNKNDEQDDKKAGAPAAAEGAAPAEVPANVQVNEDGSITIAETGISAVAPAPQRFVGKDLQPDARYGSLLVTKFINSLMYDGKKSVAEGVFYKAMDEVANKLKSDPLNVFDQAISNAKPLVEVRSKRIGGANYQVPVEVTRKRQQTLAIRWILEAVRGRKGRPTAEKLAQELMDCYNKTGATVQKRENTHRMAEANKAFAHFA
jgi:small subunit ribosomal protein S7